MQLTTNDPRTGKILACGVSLSADALEEYNTMGRAGVLEGAYKELQRQLEQVMTAKQSNPRTGTLP